MNWLNNIKKKFSLRKIRILERRKQYHRDFIDIENAKRIGVIVNINQCSGTDLKLLSNYLDKLQSHNAKVVLIEINYQKKSTPLFRNSYDTIFINPSKINWLGHLVPEAENKIKAKELDILMDFDLSGNITSKYICSLANVKTRAGSHAEGFESCYELMVEPHKDNEVGTMIKEFDYFLKMIEK